MELTLKITHRDPSTSLGMTRLCGRLFFVVVAILANAIYARAAEVIPPKPDRYFNDYAGVVSRGVAERLNTQLAQFERDTSDQIVVAVYQKMQSDSSIEDYAQRIAQTWQVGQKDKRNGVVLLVFLDNRKASIQVGYGLEGTLTDAVSRLIIENAILPRFRVNDFAGGISRGVDDLIQVLSGDAADFQRRAAAQANSPPQTTDYAQLIVILLIIGVWLFLASRSRRRGYGTRMPWIIPMGGGWSSPGWGGGGGGFSGGGGSFGGGGASGRW